MGSDTHYDKRLDKDFVFELCKRGKVDLCSSQITVRGEAIDLKGIDVPEDMTIEFVGIGHIKDQYHAEAMITFALKD